jgi:predicted acyl esterase
LAKTAPLDGGSVSYQSDEVSLQMDSDSEELSFQYTFPHRALFVGCARVVLYMSCNDHDDMDVFVQVRKADRKGRTLQNMNIPLSDLNMDASDVDTVNPLKYLGPTGVLRASHRDIDIDLSNTSWTEHDYSRNSPVPRGQVVRMEIGLWQTGIVFDAGEKIVLKVSGHNMTLAEFPPLRGALLNGNVGSHYVHFGGSYQSHLLVPLVDLPLGAHEENTLCGTRASGL